MIDLSRIITFMLTLAILASLSKAKMIPFSLRKYDPEARSGSK